MQQSQNFSKIGQLISHKAFDMSQTLIESKEEYCNIHKKDFINEYHNFPSGRKFWIGCNACRQDRRDKKILQEQLKMFEEYARNRDSKSVENNNTFKKYGV